MDILAGIDLSTIGFVALASFGAVAAVNFKWKLTSFQNFWLSAAFALAFGFVPADMGNLILNRVKDALATATALNGAYQFLGGVVKKFAVGFRETGQE